MKLSWKDLFSSVAGEERSSEEEERLDKALDEAMVSLRFEEVASSIREKYPNATNEDLERAITMKEDGYEVAYSELPPKPFKEMLEEYLRFDIEKIRIISDRSFRTCEVCREADGKVYETEEALEEMTLPHEECECESRAFKEEGECYCDYVPATSFEDPDPSLYP
jgi:hypothetical protein